MDDPWFNYFRGRGRLQVTPRNAKGWAATIAFVIAITAPAFAVRWLVEISPWLLVPYFALLLLGIVLFVRWAKRHSQVIDIDEIGRDYAEFKEWKKRNRR